MTREIFAIRDKKANVFLPPMFSDNVQTVKRSLVLPANGDDSFIGLYPEDYDVYRLGYFDDNTGEFTQCKTNEFCFHITELVKKIEVKKDDESKPESESVAC